MNSDPAPVLKPPKGERSKLGLGFALTSLAAILLVASFILVWFGVFPGLVALALAIPLAIAGVRMMRKGEATTVAQR